MLLLLLLLLRFKARREMQPTQLARYMQ